MEKLFKLISPIQQEQLQYQTENEIKINFITNLPSVQNYNTIEVNPKVKYNLHPTAELSPKIFLKVRMITVYWCYIPESPCCSKFYNCFLSSELQLEFPESEKSSPGNPRWNRAHFFLTIFFGILNAFSGFCQKFPQAMNEVKKFFLPISKSLGP